jgi:hypothetical protein
VRWDRPGGVVLADESVAHVACYERAEVDRLLAAGGRALLSPDALEDEAELTVRGEPLP